MANIKMSTCKSNVIHQVVLMCEMESIIMCITMCDLIILYLSALTSQARSH